VRPKKVVLCIAKNEQDLSTLAFQLNVWGYKSLRAQTAEDAIRLFTENQIDLVLADFAFEIVGKLKQISPHIQMIVRGDVTKANLSPMELCERIKIMSARKRGPRPGRSMATPSSLAMTACLA
jgi:CheY-like chemotaxis protein